MNAFDIRLCSHNTDGSIAQREDQQNVEAIGAAHELRHLDVGVLWRRVKEELRAYCLVHLPQSVFIDAIYRQDAGYKQHRAAVGKCGAPERDGWHQERRRCAVGGTLFRPDQQVHDEHRPLRCNH